MAVWSGVIEPPKGQQDPLAGQFVWTQQIGGFSGKAPTQVTSRKQAVRGQIFVERSYSSRHKEYQETFRLNSFGKEGPGDGQQLAALGLDMGPLAPASSWGDLVPSELRRPARCEMGSNAEAVIELCQQGQVSEAVEALGLMVQAECRVAKSLVYAVLKQCVAKRDLALGRCVHALSVRKGYESDTFLCNHILRMYASHARLEEAMNVFAALSEPDAFTWSAIISAHVKQGQDKQAVQLYHRMRMSGIKPDAHVFVAALQACAKGVDLESGQKVHADVMAGGLQRDLFVSSCLVDMYAKCGSLEDAQRLFDGLPRKDVVTWSALIAGYSQQGMGQEALRLYSCMLEEGLVAPNSVTFLCLLQACACVGPPALAKGRQLHAQIREQELQTDVSVANSLVNMYAKCGNLEAARQVFEGLDRKTVVTWNVMIAGYSQQGMGQEALRLYRAMQEEGMMTLNSATCVCLLQACASAGSCGLENGRELHAQIRGEGLQADVFVASSLVNMYAKCGSLEDARNLFDSLHQKDVVTWGAMIGAYSQQGMGWEAIQLYRAMREEGIVSPDSVTFMCLLQACARVGTLALDAGKQLHAQIRERGLQADVAVGGRLVNMYVKCGSLVDAQDVFVRLGEKNVVTWNVMITGYSQLGMAQEALGLYRGMQEEGSVTPDCVTFAGLLQSCASLGTPALEQGRQLYAQIRERGLQADPFVASSLVNMYAKCGSLEDARDIFDRLSQKDSVTWSTLIAAYSQQGMGQEALNLYRAMQEEDKAAPTSVTYVCLLQACAGVGNPALEKGKQIHAKVKEHGFQDDPFVASSLVNMYAKCGSLEDARTVFDGLGERNVVMWNAMIAGYAQHGMGQEAFRLYRAMQDECTVTPDSVTFVSLLQACAVVGIPALETGKQLHAQLTERGLLGNEFVASSLINMYAKCGNLESAQDAFDELPQKHVVTWNAMIAGYSQKGMGLEALRLYKAMQEDGMEAPDSVTFLCLVQACANVAALHLGRQLHAQIKEAGFQADMLIAGSLINMYGKCGSMEDAVLVFEAMARRDVAAWNALISGYANLGNSKQVFHLVLRMRESGIPPDSITFSSVLTVCSHTGLVNEGRRFFEEMTRLYGISPTAEHYTCMVDLLGRAGFLDEALSLLTTMPFPPDAAVWNTLLGACRKWSNVEVGRHAFDEAVKVDKNDAGAYLLMSNIYADAQMWERAREVQAWKAGIGARKEPGQSWWTDMDGLVLSFSVGYKYVSRE